MEDNSSTQDVRVISVYATRWRKPWQAGDNGKSHLQLGRLDEFYSLFQEQLPRVLDRIPHDPDTVSFLSVGGDSVVRSRMAGLTVTRAEVWLFALPSDQVVAALDIDFLSPPLGEDASWTINVLENGAYGQIEIDGKGIEGHIADLARSVGAKEIDTNALLPPERHQIVFASDIGGGAAKIEETIALILYRSDPPYRPQFMEVRRPSGLNAEQAIGAVTPYVSLLSGHPEYVENSVFLTVVQAVGTSARFRQIWHKAHGRVRDFRSNGQEANVGVQRKAAMEFLADELGNLELDLSFSVEASADLGLLIPLLRIESFHKDLYEVMELRERANTVSRMFTRLDASIRSELTAIEIREQQENEERRLRRGAAVSVLSFVAVPLGFLLAFFGINADQVNGDWSIFDLGHYLTVYVAATALAVTPFIAFLILNGRAWVISHREKQDRKLRTAQEAAGQSPEVPFPRRAARAGAVRDGAARSRAGRSRATRAGARNVRSVDDGTRAGTGPR